MQEEEKLPESVENEEGSVGSEGNAGDTPQQKKKTRAEIFKELRAKKKAKSGDYTVQVNIIEARGLKGRDFGDISDPVCKVQVMDQKQSTSIKKRCMDCVWDETKYFFFKNVDSLALEQGRIKISVYDANAIRTNVLIGSYELDAATVYYQDNHELYRQWVALSDETDAHEGIQGPGDEQKIHDGVEEDEEETSMLCVLMPPSIPTDPKLLLVNAWQVADLPEMDENFVGSKCDPYIKVDFAGITIETKHVKGQNADIYRSLQIPVMEPILQSLIRISVYDFDLGSSNDRISTFLVNYNKIKEQDRNTLPCRWYHLYGAPKGMQSNKIAKRMNRGYIEGSAYRGRVLLSFGVEDKVDPVKQVSKLGGGRSIGGEVDANVYELPHEVPYSLQVDVYEGAEIVSSMGPMHIEVVCGSTVIATDPQKVENGVVEYYQSIGSSRRRGAEFDIDKETILNLPEDLTQCPDVFIYLCNKRKNKSRVSYTRIPFQDLVEQGFDAEPQWYTLKEDKSIDMLKINQFPGSILMGIRVGRSQDAPEKIPQSGRPFLSDFIAKELGEEEEQPEVAGRGRGSGVSAEEVPLLEEPKEVKKSAPKVEEVKATTANVIVEVIKGENLPAMDRNGYSDPFCKLQMVSNGDPQLFPKYKLHKTKIVKKTLNPLWQQSFVFSGVPVDEATIKLQCFDWDTFGNDFIGDGELPLQGILGNKRRADMTITQQLAISDKFPDAIIMLRISFQWLKTGFNGNPELQLKTQEKRQRDVEKKGFQLFKKLGLGGKKRKGNPGLYKYLLGSPKKVQYQLRCHIYLGRNLMSSDQNGLTDTYLIIRCGNKHIKTQVVHGTTNPHFFTTYTMNVTLPQNLLLAPDIQIQVFDKDMLTKDDYLGRFAVSCIEQLTQNKEGLKPEWFEIRNADDEPTDGEMLCAFEFLEGGKILDAVPDLYPKTRDMVLQVAALGLRDVNPAGFHAVKPYIQFFAPGKGHLSKPYTSQPSATPTSDNPNFLEVMCIPVSVPLDPVFAPTLDIHIKDRLFGGLYKKLIGTCSLDLTTMIEESGKPGGNMTIEILDEKKLEEELKTAEELKQAEEQKKKEEEFFAKRKEELLMERTRRELLEQKRESKKRPHLTMVTSSSSNRRASESQRRPTNADGESAGVDEKKEEVEVEVREITIEVPDGAVPEAKEVDHEVDPDLQDFTEDTTGEAEWNPRIKLEEDPLPYMVGRGKVDDELEDVFDMCPFSEIPFFTGQKNANKLFGLQQKQTGLFKGVISLTTPENLADTQKVVSLLRPKSLFVRLYILRGHKLRPLDSNGLSDPYLKIKCGKEEFSTRDRYISNDINPEFFEKFEFPVVLPGTSKLQITCMDWDGIGDDLIGKTTIDLEDRWYSQEWRSQKLKPVEFRTLHSEESSFSQGKLELWVEILTPEQRKAKPMWNITPPPPQPYELRVIVWKAKDVVIKDTITEQNDLYVTGELESEKGFQKTDLHYRSKEGYGCWNYRMKYPVLLPVKSPPRFKFNIFDKDFFSANDSIASVNMGLTGLFRQAVKEKKSVRMRQKKIPGRLGKKVKGWLMTKLEEQEHKIADKLKGKKEDEKDETAAIAGDIELEEIKIEGAENMTPGELKRKKKEETEKRKKKQVKALNQMHDEEKIWIELFHPNYEGPQGYLQVSFEIMPQSDADQLKNGLGREEPNQYPVLPPPDGRLEWTLNPWSMLKQILGDKICWRLFIIIGIGTIIALATYFLPDLISGVFANGISGWLSPNKTPAP